MRYVRTTVRWQLLYYAILGLALWWAMFRLPFLFPPATRIRSTSYPLGFNNGVSISAIAAAVGLIGLYRLGSRKPTRLGFSGSTGNAIPAAVVGAMVLVYAVFTGAIYKVAALSSWYGLDWESSHFLWKLKLTDAYGLTPYTDYQFEYGPALIYVPILLHKVLRPFGATPELSYYISHFLLNITGLFCIVYILNRCIGARSKRVLAFVALGAVGFLPNMGLNGVILRYIAPYFGLVFIHEAVDSKRSLRSIRVFLVTVLAAALCVALSAEIGIGFLICAMVYAMLSFRAGSQAWPVLGALLAAALLSPAVLPRAYYVTMGSFAQGGNNLPLLPTSPHLMLYLATMIWMVPQWLPKFASGKKDGVLVSALGVLCLCQMPGALGRCDPYHVMFFSLGLAALALADLSNTSTLAFRLFAASYVAVFFIGLEIINAWVFHLSPVSIKEWINAGHPESVRLEPLLKYNALAAPFGGYGYSKPVQQWLWTHQKVAPEHYVGGVGIYTEQQTAERLQDIGRFRHALIMKYWLGVSNTTSYDACSGDWEYLHKAFLYPRRWKWPCLHQPLSPDLKIAQYLQREYHVVEIVGELAVLEKNR